MQCSCSLTANRGDVLSRLSSTSASARARPGRATASLWSRCSANGQRSPASRLSSKAPPGVGPKASPGGGSFRTRTWALLVVEKSIGDDIYVVSGLPGDDDGETEDEVMEWVDHAYLAATRHRRGAFRRLFTPRPPRGSLLTPRPRSTLRSGRRRSGGRRRSRARSPGRPEPPDEPHDHVARHGGSLRVLGGQG